MSFTAQVTTCGRINGSTLIVFRFTALMCKLEIDITASLWIRLFVNKTPSTDTDNLLFPPQFSRPHSTVTLQSAEGSLNNHSDARFPAS